MQLLRRRVVTKFFNTLILLYQPPTLRLFFKKLHEIMFTNAHRHQQKPLVPEAKPPQNNNPPPAKDPRFLLNSTVLGDDTQDSNQSPVRKESLMQW